MIYFAGYQVFRNNGTFALQQELVKEAIILGIWIGFGVQFVLFHGIAPPHYGRMDENIPKMHTPFYLFMPGRGYIFKCYVGCKVLEYAPATNQVYLWVFLQKSYLTVKSFRRTNVTTIEPGNKTGLVLLHDPLKPSV
jgi:hypothetical protein